jgi:hypothetical protein
MSELLEKAAAALGIPEALAKRSAEARAAETGAEIDEILAGWAGDAPPPEAAAPSPEAEEAETEEPAAETPEEPEAAEAEPARAPTPAPAPVPEIVVEIPQPEPVPVGGAPAFAAAARPPVLVGVRDNPIPVLAGVVGLFVMVVLVGLVGPALPFDAPGARSSEIRYSELAEEGKEVYSTLGCVFCHTQMVRPVVADVGLGAVTLHDTNQVLGLRRFGPDLSDVGSRMTTSEIEAVIGGLRGHPPHTLAAEDLRALAAYLSESQTSPDEPAPPDVDEDTSDTSGEGSDA